MEVSSFHATSPLKSLLFGALANRHSYDIISYNAGPVTLHCELGHQGLTPQPQSVRKKR